MKKITGKKINKLVPIIYKNAITKLLLNYQGKLYEQKGNCPKCGYKESYKNQIYERTFCKLILDNRKFYDVKIRIRKYTCKKCGKVHSSIDAPIIKGFLYAKPIIDLVLYFAEDSFNAIEKNMMDLGIQVDRDTIRLWFQKFGNRIETKRITNSKIQKSDEDKYLDILNLLFDEKLVKKMLKEMEVVADETYPAIKGAKKELREKNKELKNNGYDEIKYPTGFTVATSYSANIKSYLSLLISKNPFNKTMATDLLSQVKNAFYILTDGHLAYKKIPDRHVRCVVHMFRNTFKKYNKKKKYPKDYFKNKFIEFRDKYLKELEKQYEKLFKQGIFLGNAITTNSIEGGNWRLKYHLKTPYKDIRSIFGRSVAIMIKESLSVFSHGSPTESFGHKNSKLNSLTEVLIT